MRRRAILATVALASSMAAVPLAGSARAQESAPEPQIVAVGWWTRSATQQAPKGGFAVATGPGGPTTVAAISVSVGEADVFTASLEAVETGGFAQEASSIQACSTPDDDWKPEEGGSLDDAPEAACDDSVLLTRDGDARSWSGELAQLFAGKTGTVSIVFVPGDEVSQSGPPAPPAPGVPPPPPPSVAPAFDVRLAAPVLDAEASELSGGGGSVITGEDGGSGSSFDDTSEPSSGSATVGESGDASYTPPPAAEPGAPAGDGGGDAAATGGTGTTGADDAGEAGGDEQAFRPLGASAGEARPWGQAALYVLIAAVLGVGAAAGRWVLRERLL